MEEPSVRRRRTPEVARQEILDAARAVLEHGIASELTVAAVMAGTAMTRKTFYVHFSDLGELIVELVRPLRVDLDRAIADWAGSVDPIQSGARSLDAAARLYVAHATLLRAVWRSAEEDPAVDAARHELIAPLVTAGTELLVRRRGLPPAEARSVAEVLATMNVHALLDLGPDATPTVVEAATAAIRLVWQSVVLWNE